MMNIFVKNSLIILAYVASNAHSMEVINYKNTKFGLSEIEFVKKFKNDNFKCESHFVGIGRQCVSKSATYSDSRVEKTTAWFIKDQLISVAIDFTKNNSNPIISNVEYELILSALEEKYGKTLEIEQKRNGDFLETHKWDDMIGQKITLTYRTSELLGTWIQVYISSDKGTDLYNSEYEKRLIKNKINKKNDM